MTIDTQMAPENFGHFTDLMDDEALVRWRQHALTGRGHDMAEFNKNSLRRTIARLDKAELERDALRKAVKSVVPDAIMFVGAHWQSENLVEFANRLLPRLQALIQPEPDPLEAFARDLFDGEVPDAAMRQFLDRLRAAATRHGIHVLAGKEGGR